MIPSPTRGAVSEAVGTAFLLATVIGSSITAQRLTGGNGALALPCNTLPTGAILTVLTLIFGPVSGAHFNPAVTPAFALRGEMPWPIAGSYVVMQVFGTVAGAWSAHVKFRQSLKGVPGVSPTSTTDASFDLGQSNLGSHH